MLMPPTSPCASRAARNHQRCPHALHAVFQSELDMFIHLLTPILGPPCAAKPNPSSAFHLGNLLSCSVMSIGQAIAGKLKLSQPELGASTLMLGIYFGLFPSLYSNKLGMHTFIQNVSDLSEHVWKAAGLQHANATDLPLCKSSSLQPSTLPTCIARCLPK